jgi:hypothetical protein
VFHRLSPGDNVEGTRYEWQIAYVAAVLEARQSEMPAKIKFALQSIQDRLNSPVEISGEERVAIESAVKALATLDAERGHGLVN